MNAGASRVMAAWVGVRVMVFASLARGEPAQEVLDTTANPPGPGVRFEFPFARYHQEVTIVFASEAAAQAADVVPTPLWDAREWAVSSRWDDTVVANLRMREVLTAHGHRGTFYLNAWFKDWSALTRSPDSPYGRALLRGGHSIGGHSLDHPWLSYCHRNRIFEEVAGVRMLWEAATDAPMNSYSFSFCDSRNEDEGDVVQSDIIRALERAGFYHVANEPSFEALPSDLILSPILPSDGDPIVEAAESALADPAYRDAHPILTYSMHAVYDTPAEWAGFERDLDRYGRNPDWWYCNQNEFAAYRYQYLHTRIRSIGPEGIASPPGVDPGRTRRLVLERPVLLDLNDPVPLTFEIRGVPSEAVTGVFCGTAKCVPADRSSRNFRFHLFHDSNQALPSVIGLAPINTKNATQSALASDLADLPGIRAHLFYKSGFLQLSLANGSPFPVTACRVTYRLPLAWTEGIVHRELPDLPPKYGVRDVHRPQGQINDYKHAAGNAFLAAQIDFRWGDRQARVHTACYASLGKTDPSYPQSGFLRIGPFPRDQVDLRQLVTDLREGAADLSTWEREDGTILGWERADDPYWPPYFDVERIRLAGRWSGWHQDGYYVIRTRVRSESGRVAWLRTAGGNFAAGIVLNGVDVTGLGLVELVPGDNSLILVCSALPAFFVRFEDPDSGERLTDIHYELPEVPPPGGIRYVPPWTDSGAP